MPVVCQAAFFAHSEVIENYNYFHFILTLRINLWELTDCISAVTYDITPYDDGIGDSYG
jgi:hypothetical protein